MNNIETEKRVISTIILEYEKDPNFFKKIIKTTGSNELYEKLHQKFFSCLKEMLIKKHPIDLYTITDYLSNNEKLCLYLKKIIETYPTIPNIYDIDKFIDKIKEKYRIRILVKEINKISNSCTKEGLEESKAIEFLDNILQTTKKNQKNKTSFNKIDKIALTIMEKIEKNRENGGKQTGILTGFDKLDKITLGLQKTDLILIGGQTSVGKTTFALDIARNAAKKNKKVLIFSLEMSEEQLVRRILFGEAKLDSNKKTNDYLDNKDMEKLISGCNKISDFDIFIEDSGNISSEDIIRKVEDLKSTNGVDLVIIDYIQLIEEKKNFQRKDLEISHISRNLKRLAKKMNIPVIALSQLSRKMEDRNKKKPRLSDLRESGALEQDADIVFFIYKEKKKIYLEIAKHRNGPTGKIELFFSTQHVSFKNS